MPKLKYRTAILAVYIALGLVACGGNDPLPAKAAISKVYVMGDSLADVGTFGLKFTVQDASNPKGFPVWPQLIADALGLNGSAQCNAFVAVPTGPTTFQYLDNPNAGCTNYAIGGARIIVPGDAASPQNIVKQLEKRYAAGPYAASELVLVDGGANDVADLLVAYLGATTTQGVQDFQVFLSQQLDAPTLGALLPQPNGGAVAAGAYMQKLADTFYAQIKAQVLDRGATRVAVLNIPDITLTPRLQMALAGVAAQSSQAAADAAQSAIRQWIVVFNTQLAARMGTDTRFALVDSFADITDQSRSPANYLISDAMTAACPPTGQGADRLPEYTFATCTSAALDASPPAGKGPGWWKSYAFSDGFHPTPYGHQLLSASVSRALARAGWL